MTDQRPRIEHEAYEFVERQLALVGDEDPLRILRNTPGEVASLFGRAPAGSLERPWAPGKWSPLQILSHMSLTEWVFGFRTRTVLCDANPVLQPVDQERWAERCGRPTGDAGDHLQDFAALRRANFRLWCGLTPEERARTGHHAEAGVDMSLDFLLRLLAGHDLNHLEQIRAGLTATE